MKKAAVGLSRSSSRHQRSSTAAKSLAPGSERDDTASIPSKEPITQRDARPKKKERVKCDECEKSYASKSDCQRHKREKHEKQRYKCRNCPRQFTRRSSLAYHLNESEWGEPCRGDIPVIEPKDMTEWSKLISKPKESRGREDSTELDSAYEKTEDLQQKKTSHAQVLDLEPQNLRLRQENERLGQENQRLSQENQKLRETAIRKDLAQQELNHFPTWVQQTHLSPEPLFPDSPLPNTNEHLLGSDRAGPHAMVAANTSEAPARSPRRERMGGRESRSGMASASHQDQVGLATHGGMYGPEQILPQADGLGFGTVAGATTNQDTADATSDESFEFGSAINGADEGRGFPFGQHQAYDPVQDWYSRKDGWGVPDSPPPMRRVVSGNAGYAAEEPSLPLMQSHFKHGREQPSPKRRRQDTPARSEVRAAARELDLMR